MPDMPLPASLAELTPEWLTHALRSSGTIRDASVTGFDYTILGEGEGFIGQLGRVRLQYDRAEDGAPETVIAKFPSPIAQNRALGALFGGYEIEIRFYNELASHVNCAIPRCYFGAFDPEPKSAAFVAKLLGKLPSKVTLTLLPVLLKQAAKSPRRYALLLEDLSACRVGDQAAGGSLEDAEQALRELARLHAGFWESPLLDQTWINSVDASPDLIQGMYQRARPIVERRYRDLFPPRIDEINDWLDANGTALLRRMSTPRTLLHGDFRLDNVMYANDESRPPVTVIDFQGLRVGNPMNDVAYFIVPNVPVEYLEEHETRLVRLYYDELVARGVSGYTWERAQEDYDLARLTLQQWGTVLVGMLDFSGGRGMDLIDNAMRRAAQSVPRIRLEGLGL